MAKQWISQQNFSTRNVLLIFGKRVGNWKLLAVAQVSNKMDTSAKVYTFLLLTSTTASNFQLPTRLPNSNYIVNLSRKNAMEKSTHETQWGFAFHA